ncbi:copper resistance system multicopper oxidase [Alteromonas sp. C1M14]|uniref:copper resistance system multicopper oxidase n=1 Tax=Alteromonas sp. C1M14 TaxID=2841567 RepID=UPI001C09B1F7|nr:copper resistance system multicopper oxidase [Alteromonas sp. C1M14]MBU2980099.1 copper resistance system multicopper oxidase [Alteromonas sp. C1M14]
MSSTTPTRRQFLCGAITSLSSFALYQASPRWAHGQGYTATSPTQSAPVTLNVAERTFQFSSKPHNTITLNGQMPGPLLRFTEGQTAVVDVTNHLKVDTSVHWHGIILPANMDGVPGLSFAGIKPNATFRYTFDIKQNGTYWYHSHSGLQEQSGHIGPMVITPKDGDIGADREHTILLSDWTFEDPEDIYRNLKVSEGYYNYQKRTLFDTLAEVQAHGLAQTWQSRSMWNAMRMDPRDIADVSASVYTYLMNGKDSLMNFEALFKPNEKVRLRLINGSAMTYFDFRIPGLSLTVVAADGQPVKPVIVDEIRIATAETYDVIVQPKHNKAYTLFAESYDRSGFVRGTLTPQLGLSAAVPARRHLVERTMNAMGMQHSMPAQHTMEMPPSHQPSSVMSGSEHSHHAHAPSTPQKLAVPIADIPVHHQSQGHGQGAAMIAHNPRPRMDEPGLGLANSQRRVLVYQDLIGATPWPDERPPQRHLELHLTGNMQRYMWSFDGKKFSEVDEPIHFEYGERLRLILVNDTMMDHPIHLHGMWMELENGQFPRPRKHTISLKPAEKLSLLITADAKGEWAFHCHLLYHMKAGMFRVVRVQQGEGNHD